MSSSAQHHQQKKKHSSFFFSVRKCLSLSFTLLLSYIIITILRQHWKLVSNYGHPPNTHHDDDSASSSSTTTSTTTTAYDEIVLKLINHRNTLALVDNHFLGGFRNQHMRFTSLVLQAVEQQQQSIDNDNNNDDSFDDEPMNLLLPSLKWVDMKSKQSIDHHLLFDVDHWNRIAVHATLTKYKQQQQQQQQKQSGGGNKVIFPIENDLISRYFLEQSSTNNTILTTTTTIEPISFPLLIPFDPIKHIDWNNQTRLFHNIDSNLVLNNPSSSFNPRRIDLFLNVSHCKSPYAYGSGIGAGRLWNQYLSLQKRRKRRKQNDGGDEEEWIEEHHIVERMLYRTMRPSRPLYQLIHSKLLTFSNTTTNNNNNNNHHNNNKDSILDEAGRGLLAVHPRIELDMLVHKCSKTMVKNLTLLFDWIQSNPDFYITTTKQQQQQNQQYSKPRFNRIFLAVSRYFIGPDANPQRFHQLGELAKENLHTLNQVITTKTTSSTSSDPHNNNNNNNNNNNKNNNNNNSNNNKGLWNGQIPVFESGEEAIITTNNNNNNNNIIITNDNNDDAHKIIIAMVSNFYLSVHSEIFLGTYGSSYSVDVWTARYYNGKGIENYQHDIIYGGIRRIGNNGLPFPHSNC